MTFAGPSASEAEAEVVVEAGMLEDASRAVYDFRVIKVRFCSPNLQPGMASDFVDFVEPETCLECVACLSLPLVFKRSAVELFELPGVDAEDATRSATLRVAGAAVDVLLGIVTCDADDDAEASSAMLEGEVEAAQLDFLGFCRLEELLEPT